jgi:hypothetical protein
MQCKSRRQEYAGFQIRSRQMLVKTGSGEIKRPIPKGEPHSRDSVPPHEKLLLLAILMVVAAWIMFRVSLHAARRVRLKGSARLAP